MSKFTISALAALATVATAAPNVVAYYGQGFNQSRLSYYCQNSAIDIIPIGFVNVFPDQEGTYGYPGTNFGNQCGGSWIDPEGHETQMFASCSQLAEDIPICQAAGKKIFISLGGDAPGNYIKDDASAVDFADYMWATFGPMPSTADGQPYTGARPFGAAVVDGFDFDIETLVESIPQGATIDGHYGTMINQLRSHFQGKPYYISGAPQCNVPDVHLSQALQTSYFDYL